MTRMTPLIHGTLDSLILRTLALEPRHGYGIARFLEDAGGEALAVGEGSLYPALYRLTPEGRQRLETETARWRAFSEAVSKVLLG